MAVILFKGHRSPFSRVFLVSFVSALRYLAAEAKAFLLRKQPEDYDGLETGSTAARVTCAMNQFQRVNVIAEYRNVYSDSFTLEGSIDAESE